MYKIIHSAKSLENIQEIFSFIEEDNPFYANRVIFKIQESIELLKEFPLIGKEKGDGLREILEPNYKFRIFYTLKDEVIYIIAILKYRNFL